MPLHLLHHKSYHVYSTTNIERVRRDEAAARAKEEAEEQRMQEADAEHRMKVLRARAEGKAIPPAPEEEPTTSGRFVAPKDSAQIRENETAVVRQPTPPPPVKRRKASPKLTGSDGHINLFSELENPHPRKKVEKNAEYEAEKKAKEDKLEAQYTMGLGKPADELRPWYSTLDMIGEVKGRKNTEWEMKKDERRKDWGDPLVAIKRGVRGVKEVEDERKEWKRSRELEVGALGFNGLNTEKSSGVKRARSESRGREHRSKRDKSPSGRHYRSRHRSRSTSKSGRHHHSHKHSRRESSTEPSSHRRHRTSGSRSRRHRSPHEDVMEKLRRERDQRERDEREKAENMLKKEREYRLPGWKAAEGGRYSSQFGIGEVRKR